MDIRIKRAYESPTENDGYRILVDRLWPRGISKEKARIDSWPKELAPSTELRRCQIRRFVAIPAFRVVGLHSRDVGKPIENYLPVSINIGLCLIHSTDRSNPDGCISFYTTWSKSGRCIFSSSSNYTKFLYILRDQGLPPIS
jgi:hypothetical protein